ncbi:MAG: hypothetical protein EOO05_01865 [Chitinophagaceae bacterium]|nr:MAG: hypothetical protein EOO05_01865 [Chitinophagaceae bacterium]
MQRIRPDVDIIKDLLDAVLDAQPDSVFTKSLAVQYQERGGLSKKQLQGLYGKASRISSIPAGKLATLEAIILKRPTRYKSDLPAPAEEGPREDATGQILESILLKYPQHKRVLFLKSKFDHREPLTATELSEIDKFRKLVS